MREGEKDEGGEREDNYEKGRMMRDGEKDGGERRMKGKGMDIEVIRNLKE
jgi:hypothetical protein